MKKQTTKINSLAKVSRIVKLYKIARFFRLSKLLKLAKAKNKKNSASKSMENALKLSEGLERFMLFGLFFSIFLHLVTCFWLMTTQYNEERNWLTIKKESLADQGEDLTSGIDIYFVSMYFVTQTITTVGYGDYSPSNIVERVFIILLMMVGVLAFSFASGSLASIIQTYDQQ